MSKKIQIALLQHAAPSTESRDSILKRVERMARQAKERGAHIICTQELFTGPYFCQEEDASRMDLAEPIPGPTTEFLSRLARELQVEIVGSLYERRAPGLYHNTAVLLDDSGALAGKYRKMHIPEDPRFYEKFYFAPGDLGWQAVSGRHAKIGMLVCWDQWYPEAARLTALKGADIIFYPTAIGWWHKETPRDAKQQKEAWLLMHRAHAIANGVFVAAANRVGVEDELKFWGGSILIDPGGEIICQGSEDKEEVLMGECDFTRIEELRRGWPFLRDRRVDAYGGLTERFLDGGQ